VTVIYALEREGEIKIGCSSNLKARFKQHETYAGKIKLIAHRDGTYGDELAIHKMLKPYRSGGGREWYVDCAAVRKIVSQTFGSIPQPRFPLNPQEKPSSGPAWFSLLAMELFGDSSAKKVHHLTGEPERTCYEWVRGKFDPPSRAVLKLLHTEAGWIVLEYLMRGCTQRWWLETVRARECSLAYEQRREQLSLPL